MKVKTIFQDNTDYQFEILDSKEDSYAINYANKAIMRQNSWEINKVYADGCINKGQWKIIYTPKDKCKICKGLFAK